MILFLHGEDHFLLNRRRQALQKAFAKKYPGAETFVFDFEDQGSPEGVRRALGACDGGLFSSEKMVIFLHPASLPEHSEKLFAGFLKEQKERSEEGRVLLFVQPGKIRKTDPVTSTLLKMTDKEELFSVLADRDVMALVKKELATIDETLAFSRQALEAFIAVVGNDTARIVSELEKLATYKAGTKTIESEDVFLLLQSSKESAIFMALDCLGRDDKKRAIVLLNREAEGTEGAYPVLSMCAWQVRRLLLVREALDGGLRRPDDIGKETKLPPFAVQKMLATVEALSLARLKRGMATLSDFDVRLKQGQMDPQVALDLFIWKF